MPKAADPKEMVETGVKSIFELEQTLKDTEAELMKNEQFQAFLKMQKVIPEQINTIWKSIEQQMMDADIKSIKGDWGSLTIAERLNWTIDYNSLPTRFWKKVADTKKISDTYRLENKAPKGAIPKTTKYLMRRIK